MSSVSGKRSFQLEVDGCIFIVEYPTKNSIEDVTPVNRSVNTPVSCTSTYTAVLHMSVTGLPQGFFLESRLRVYCYYKVFKFPNTSLHINVG